MPKARAPSTTSSGWSPRSRKLTPQPIKYVVVGSEHGDHTGGIAAFPAGVVYLAHPFSAPRIKQPTEPVADRRVITLGGTEIDVLFLGRAHTGGDLEVYLPREKILFMSEVFSNRIFPSMANGYPSGVGGDAEEGGADGRRLLRAGTRLRRQRGGHARGGAELPPRARADHRRGHAAARRRNPIENATAAARFEPYDGWTRAANNAFAALKRVYMELDGQLE